MKTDAETGRRGDAETTTVRSAEPFDRLKVVSKVEPCGVRNNSSARSMSSVVMVLCALFSLAATSRAELVDRMVAAVNNDVITLSELQQAVAFNAALGGKGNGRRLERETLQGIINRRLLLQEAYRLKVAEVSEQDIAAEVGRFRERLGTETAFREFLVKAKMTEAQLEKLLGERLLVERFVEKKISLFARVNRDDVQAYFREHPDEFKDKRFAEVQKEITARLSEQKADQQLDQYVEELRSRAFIRINPVREEGQ